MKTKGFKKMKEIKAYIKPIKCDDVIDALKKSKFVKGISVSTIEGYSCSNPDEVEDFKTYKKIEIVCDDLNVDNIISDIKKHAHTGLLGDGHIYIYNVEKKINIINP